MMRNFVLRAAIGASLAFVPLSADAALVCRAVMDKLIFSQVPVQDEPPHGKATVSCSGGIAHTMVRVELMIGSDDGRRRVDGTPRFMTNDGAAQLAYAVNSESGGGTLERDFELDEDGGAMILFTLSAEITSPVSDAIVGSYKSDDFVEFTYCEIGQTVDLVCVDSAPTTTKLFTVEASVTTSCGVSVSDMDFGNIPSDVVAAVDQTAIILVTCTNASAYTIGLEQGDHSEDSGPIGRRMNNSGNLLAYGLYRDAARSESWGQNEQHLWNGEGIGGEQSLTVFGRIFAGQKAFAGTYSDTVVVILTY